MRKSYQVKQYLLQRRLNLLSRLGGQVNHRQFSWKQFNSPSQWPLLMGQSRSMQWTDEQKCLAFLSWAMQDLGAKVAWQVLEKIAELITECMTHPNRCFHCPAHIFDVADGGDAIEVVAALFHDIVYVQVDGGINVNLSAYIAPFVKEVRGRLMIRPAEELPTDQGFELVATLFDTQPSQHLALEQNEFLSALVAVKCLEPILSWAELAELVACIEATIPFRPPSPLGLKPGDRLYQNLRIASHRFNLGLTEVQILTAVQRSVRLANRDVINFAEPQAVRFLNNTWKLLPETNPVLRDASTYTVRQYRSALERMASFMNFLDPALVFREFEGEPSAETYQDLLQRANKNIHAARLYLEVKLVAIAILEALSLRLGDNVPLHSLVGQYDSNASPITWQKRLPDIEPEYTPQSSLEQEVMDLLEEGRTQESHFDIRNSPLAAFLVKSHGFEGVMKLLNPAKAFFQERISAEAFLEACDQPLVEAVKGALLKELEMRKTALLEHQ
jgi:hypothetical protein